MSVSNTRQLHWTQRVALVRHNLHTASRSGDFVFFKTLQAAGFIEGTNHAASLSEGMGDDADSVLAAMDNLNAGLAYIHQDAYKNVHDDLKNSMRDADEGADKSKLFVDITMQKNMADMAIDKCASSAITLIEQQPEHMQDCAANVWITGATIVADTLEIALREMDSLEYKMDDFIRLEDSWNNVKASVTCSITALKGVFSLMDQCSTSQQSSSDKGSGRSPSIASTTSAMFRRMSNAFVGAGSAPTSRHASIASTNSGSGPKADANINPNLAAFHRNASVSSLNGPVYRTPNYVRNSVSAGCPTSMPAGSNWGHHKLSMIPPTPAALDLEADPFDTSVAPPMPAIPAIPAMAAQAAESAMDGQRRMSMVVN